MTEPEKSRIAATYNLAEHPAINACVLGAVFFFFIWFLNNTFEAVDQKLIPFFWLFCIASGAMALGQLVKLAHPVYFTPEGLEFCRFGRVYASLSWNQISQVSIRNPDRTRMSRGKRYLELTTVCYPHFHFINIFLTGLIQKTFFDVIRLDPTRKNIEAIKRFYGELDYEAK